MTSSTAVSSAPVTSWWYGQGCAVDVVRRLESLYTLSPAPAAPAGLITARRDELIVTFVAGLKSPLPHPWRPADSANEARIPWDAVNPNVEPDPDRPVYLVVLGTTDDGALVGLNLAAFQRIRIDGDSATTTALVSRWVLELLATHPDITIGVTHDVWRGPLTTRVQAVAVGRVPQVDVLVCGPDLTYTDRAQIVSNAASKIMIDLGRDAAVDTKWTISCSPDRLAQISNGVTRPMTATLILPSPATVERCSDLLTDLPPAPTNPPPTAKPRSMQRLKPTSSTTPTPTHSFACSPRPRRQRLIRPHRCRPGSTSSRLRRHQRPGTTRCRSSPMPATTSTTPAHRFPTASYQPRKHRPSPRRRGDRRRSRPRRGCLSGRCHSRGRLWR